MKKVKVVKTKYDILVEALCLLLLIGTLIYLLLQWSNIPDLIPGHYNAKGEIDRMGSKYELFFLVVVTWLMYIGISLVGKFPSTWNVGVQVTKENKERVYRIVRNMIGTLKITVVSIFTYLTINSATAVPLSPWFLPGYLLLIFVPMIYYIVKLILAK